jgi:hypothetical protein
MQLSLESLLYLFDSYHSGTRYHGLVNFVAATGTATFSNGSTNVVVSGGHNLVLGNRIRFSGSPPAPFNTNTTYYVVEVVNTTTFRVATAPTGSPIAATANGSATYTEQPLNGCDPLRVWAKHELNVTGYSRISFTYPSAVYDATQQVVTCTPVSLSRTGANLVYTHAFVVAGGNSTPRDATGRLEYWQAFSGVQVVEASQTAVYTITPKFALIAADTTGLNPCSAS